MVCAGATVTAHVGAAATFSAGPRPRGPHIPHDLEPAFRIPPASSATSVPRHPCASGDAQPA